MTIIAKGHVVSLTQGDSIKNTTRVTMMIEAERGCSTLVINASRGETSAYYPGMPVEIHVRPAPEASV